MSRLQLKCNYCSEPAIVENSYPLFDEQTMIDDITNENPTILSYLEVLKCGHIQYRYKHENGSADLLRTAVYQSLSGEKQTRTYQVEGLRFIEQSNFNCLVADQQGLGKTIELLLAIRENNKLIPALVVVKSSTLWQWQRETKDWAFSEPNGVWIIRNGKDFIPPGFKIYLLSMDTLRMYVTPTESDADYKKRLANRPYWMSTTTRNFVVNPRLMALGIKTLVADEVHSFKNSDSKRSQALVEYCKLAQIEHKIFLSGTPIMNRASEYFVTLNLLAPDRFPSEQKFRDKYLTDDGSRIHHSMIDRFKSDTEDLIIRRERNQVLQDLPPFQRVFEDITIENSVLRRHYNEELDDIADKDAKKKGDSDLSYNDIKDNLMRMRRIVGKAKAELIVDFVHDFMDSTDSEKLTIGVHHKEVRDMLLIMLKDYRPLSLSGEDSSERKQAIVDTFAKPERRLLIANVIAGGTGLNLQFCNNCIVLERQWNAAMEEQFEDRFNRYGQTLPVTSMYPRALKTVDQFFSDLVEQKRHMFGETVALDYDAWMTNGQVRDMVDWMFSQGRI